MVRDYWAFDTYCNIAVFETSSK